MNYDVCSIMLKGRVKRKINLDDFYQVLSEKYPVEYNPEVTNRMIVHLPAASVLFFSSGTVQVYLKNPSKKEETLEEANRMISLLDLKIAGTIAVS